MSKFTDSNIKWVLPIITVIRYVFIGLVLVALIVWSFDAQDTFLAPYFQTSAKDSYLLGLFGFEAYYWILRYKKLYAETRGGKHI